MADAFELLRHDALQKRIHGIAGGLRIVWSAKDVAQIHDHVAKMKPEMLVVRDTTMASRKLVDIAAIRAKSGVQVRAAKSDDRNFAFVISSTDVDLSGDVVTVSGINTDNFRRNPAVLNSHDSASFPVAASSAPAVADQIMTAVAHFPELGVSKASDSMAAAVRGRLVRGASIGFIPKRWSFSEDPLRPMGINFNECVLLEWSICAIPCNPAALLLGAVDGGKSANRRDRNAPDDVPNEDDRDWVCQGLASLALDVTDDPYDAASAKAALLAECSKGGTILSDEAAQYFLAFDPGSPWDPASYMFPFARVTSDVCVASKIGWRQSLTALEKSDIPGLPVIDARMLVDTLESRLGDAKTAERRREARLLVAEAKKDFALSVDDPPPTRAQRLAEARKLRASLGL